MQLLAVRMASSQDENGVCLRFVCQAFGCCHVWVLCPTVFKCPPLPPPPCQLCSCGLDWVWAGHAALPSAFCDNDDDSGAAASQVTKLSEELSQLKARLASKRKEVSCHGHNTSDKGNANRVNLCYRVDSQA